MKWYKVKTVQKGRQLPDEKAVMNRLRQILDNPKSAYHKDLAEGRIQVQQSRHRRYTATKVEYDLVVMEEIEPEGLDTCAQCLKKFFAIEPDYLCEECRSQI